MIDWAIPQATIIVAGARTNAYSASAAKHQTALILRVHVARLPPSRPPSRRVHRIGDHAGIAGAATKSVEYSTANAREKDHIRQRRRRMYIAASVRTMSALRMQSDPASTAAPSR